MFVLHLDEILNQVQDDISMQSIIKKALKILQKGGIVAHATETCYGFTCDAFHKKALERLYKIKQMDRKKPVSIMVSDLKMAKKYGRFNKIALRLAKKYWPGPLTIIVKRKESLPEFLNPYTTTSGFRMPKHKLSLNLIKKMDRPLITTSANISGEPSPYSVSAIRKQFRGKKYQPDFIIDGGRIPRNPPSTIMEIMGTRYKIIRKGDLSLK